MKKKKAKLYPWSVVVPSLIQPEPEPAIVAVRDPSASGPRGVCGGGPPCEGPGGTAQGPAARVPSRQPLPRDYRGYPARASFLAAVVCGASMRRLEGAKTSAIRPRAIAPMPRPSMVRMVDWLNFHKQVQGVYLQ